MARVQPGEAGVSQMLITAQNYLGGDQLQDEAGFFTIV